MAKFSPIVACIGFTVAGHFMMAAYGKLHWGVGREFARLMMSLQTNDVAFAGARDFASYHAALQQIRDSAGTAMNYLEAHHLCGALSVVFAVWSLRAGPKPAAFVTVPFGLYGLFQLIAVM